jgi:hypothetical protein
LKIIQDNGEPLNLTAPRSIREILAYLAVRALMVRWGVRNHAVRFFNQPPNETGGSFCAGKQVTGDEIKESAKQYPGAVLLNSYFIELCNWEEFLHTALHEVAHCLEPNDEHGAAWNRTFLSMGGRHGSLEKFLSRIGFDLEIVEVPDAWKEHLGIIG